MSKKYIAIEREYGSGGTTIARRLSEESGVPCYGQEILEAVSKKLGVSVSTVERYEETVTTSFLYSIFAMSQANQGNLDLLPEEERIFIEEQAEIQNFAGKGSAIFLGHCAAQALEDHKNVIRVFIRCSDMELKKRRIMNDYGVPESQAEATRKKKDKKRANYYAANTGKKWDALQNYDVVLDSAALGVDGCVKMLKALYLEG